MASENETVADIVKKKRDTADEAELEGKNTLAFDLAKMLREEADRIEAAWKREREAGAEAAQTALHTRTELGSISLTANDTTSVLNAQGRFSREKETRGALMAKRLCEFSTSSSHFGSALRLYAWAIYRRGDIPDAGEFAYINKRVLDKYPTAEFVSLRRTLVCTIGGRPATKVRWEFEWVVLDSNKEVRDEN